MKKPDAERIYSLLARQYPDSRDSPAQLSGGSAFEVLVLTILSAQTTDRAVLKVKGPLFSAYPTPSALAKAKTDDVETIIHSLGYFHAKARHIIAASQAIISEFGGSVPETMEDLLKIPGVGRKTANIVLYHAHGRNEGIAVDTHVMRLAQRLGLTKQGEPVKIEKDLMEITPNKEWGNITHLLIFHGRKICPAKKPLHEECVLFDICPSRNI
jgi:endonuclease-3